MPSTAQPPVSAPKGTFTPRGLASLLGRNQDYEFWYSTPFQPGVVQKSPLNMNLNRPAESIMIRLQVRARFTDADIDTLGCEAPQTLLSRVVLQGTHVKFNSMTPQDLTGPWAFTWGQCFQSDGNRAYLQPSTAGSKQILPTLGTPISTLVGGVTFGKKDVAYDLDLYYAIPLTPWFGPWSRLAAVPFLYQPEDWNNSLYLQLTMGDGTSFGHLGASNVTFTAYGEDSGSGLLSVFVNYQILGPAAPHIGSAVCVRNSQPFIQDLSTGGTNIRLAQLQIQKTTNLIFKTGAQIDPASLGTNVGNIYSFLDDGILDLTQIVADNKPVRNNFDNNTLKQFFNRIYNTELPQGYNGFTFIDSGNPLTYYRGDLVQGGSTFQLVSSVITPDGGLIGEYVQEMIFGDPEIRMGTAA